MGCINSVAFLFLFSPCGNSAEAVAKSLRKQRSWWILPYHPESSYFPLVPFQFGNLSYLLIGKFSMDINIFNHFFLLLIRSSLLNPGILPTVLQETKKKKRCIFKVLSEDVRKYSNGSNGPTAAEWDLPSREKRGLFLVSLRHAHWCSAPWKRLFQSLQWKQWRMRLFKWHKLSLHQSVRLSFSSPVLRGCSSSASALAPAAVLNIAWTKPSPCTHFPHKTPLVFLQLNQSSLQGKKTK